MKHWLMNTQVDGVEVVITRASGAIEEVTVIDGKFTTSVVMLSHTQARCVEVLPRGV